MTISLALLLGLKFFIVKAKRAKKAANNFECPSLKKLIFSIINRVIVVLKIDPWINISLHLFAMQHRLHQGK
jgi:hypothetical protein